MDNGTVIEPWIRASVSANLPFWTENIEQMRYFFKEHVRGGGPIPKSRGLSPYLKDCYTTDVAEMTRKLSDRVIILYYDETYDKLGRFVSNILMATVDKLYFPDVKI